MYINCPAYCVCWLREGPDTQRMPTSDQFLCPSCAADDTNTQGKPTYWISPLMSDTVSTGKTKGTNMTSTPQQTRATKRAMMHAVNTSEDTSVDLDALSKRQILLHQYKDDFCVQIRGKLTRKDTPQTVKLRFVVSEDGLLHYRPI